MNCANCGAPMELIESRRYFFCRHCGSFHFPQEVSAEGIRLLGITNDAPSCPMCKVPLAAALLDDTHPGHFCAKCRGVLLPRVTFAKVVSARRNWASNPPAEARPIDRAALERSLSCPSCGATCDTSSYCGPGNVVIDNCGTCDIVWLDFGELRQIVDAPGHDRGAREKIVGYDAFTTYPTPPPRGEPSVDTRRDPLAFLFDLLS